MRISSYFRGRNMMTPEVIDYGEIEGKDGRRYFVEVSEGTGFLTDSKIFGLTVVSVDENGKVEKENGLSECFDNLVDLQLILKAYGLKYYSAFVKEVVGSN